MLRAADRLAKDDQDFRAISDLVDAGSSLGGARPKAAVITANGRLALAKFPHLSSDEWDVPGWEKLEAELALRSGVDVAATDLVKVKGRNVLVSYRFDRLPSGGRIGFVSALTMLEAFDQSPRSYLEIAEVIERHSPHARRDLVELYRRMAFSALTGNTDDHLRNHGFLRVDNGWRLAPAYDINPNPDNPGQLTTSIDLDDPSIDIDLLLSVAPYFRLTEGGAREEIAKIEEATAGWQELAEKLGLPKAEIERMRGAFDTDFRAAAQRTGQLVAVPFRL